MIEAFVGRLGGGKTYYAVERIMKYISNGGCVCSNISIVREEVKAFCRRNYSWEMSDEQYIYLEGEQIAQFHRFTPSGTPDMHSLVVIDEAHLWLNAREWNKASKELLSFLTQSRKCFTDIIFISQDLKNMDKQIARLVQYVWRFKDMATWKFGFFQIKWPLPQFLRIQYDYDGKTELDKELVLKNKNIYKCYKSYQLHTDFPRLKAQTKFEGKIKKKGSKMRLLIFFGIVVLMFLVFGYKLKDKIGIGKRSAEKTLTEYRGQAPAKINDVEEKPIRKAVINPVLEEAFVGIIEDERGRVVITDCDKYQLGKICRLGKVVGCYEDKVMVAGYDGKPRMILPRKQLPQNQIAEMKGGEIR